MRGDVVNLSDQVFRIEGKKTWVSKIEMADTDNSRPTNTLKINLRLPSKKETKNFMKILSCPHYTIAEK